MSGCCRGTKRGGRGGVPSRPTPTFLTCRTFLRVKRHVLPPSLRTCRACGTCGTLPSPSSPPPGRVTTARCRRGSTFTARPCFSSCLTARTGGFRSRRCSTGSMTSRQCFSRTWTMRRSAWGTAPGWVPRAAGRRLTKTRSCARPSRCKCWGCRPGWNSPAPQTRPCCQPWACARSRLCMITRKRPRLLPRTTSCTCTGWTLPSTRVTRRGWCPSQRLQLASKTWMTATTRPSFSTRTRCHLTRRRGSRFPALTPPSAPSKGSRPTPVACPPSSSPPARSTRSPTTWGGRAAAPHLRVSSLPTRRSTAWRCARPCRGAVACGGSRRGWQRARAN